MNNMLRHFSISRLSLILILLTSCSMPSTSGSSETSSGLNAWLDQPTTSATLPLAPFALKAHAQNPGGGVDAIEFEVNGVTLTSVTTDASQPLVYAEFEWNPSAAGQYDIRAVAVGGGARSASDIALVCVSGEVKVASLGFNTSDCSQGIAPPAAAVPTQITPSQLQLDFKFGASPDPVYYGLCKSEPRAVNFETVVYDLSTGNTIDPSLVSSVSAHYVIRNSSGVNADFQLALTSTGAGIYANSVDIDANAASTLGSGDGTIDYWIEVLDTGGASARSITLTINLQNCGAITPITSVPPTVPPAGVTPPPQIPTDTPVPPKPVDTTPPLVDINSISATDVYYTTGCGPNTLTVDAYVTDATGVGSVTLIVSYIGTGAEGIFVPMMPVGGNIYRGTHDVGSQAYAMFAGVNGQIGLYVEARDSNGNVSGDDGGTVNVWYCPG